MDSRLDFEVRMVTPSRGRRRRILDRADFNELERASPALSVLLDGLFRDRNFGSIEISRYEHLNHDTSTIGRLFENMMHLGRVSKHSNQDNKLHIKSTLERWSDVLKMYYLEMVVI